MSKRSALQTTSSAKRAKLDPMVVGVMDALEASADLNPTCKAMLRAACPLSLGLPADKRHESHNDVVSMIDEVLTSSARNLEFAVGAVEDKTAALETKKCELAQTVQGEESQLNSLIEAVKAAQQEAEAASLVATKADEVFRQCLEAQREGDKDANVLNEEQVCLKNATEQHLKPVQFEELEEPVAQKHAQVLQSLTQRLTLDEALIASLPKACTKVKSSRGVFDVMVLDAFAEILGSQLASIDEKLQAELPGVAARAEALAEALRGVEATAEAHKGNADALRAALAAEKEQRTVVAVAEAAVLASEVEIAKVGKDHSSASSAFEDFKTWPLECFYMLKNKVSVAEAAGA